MFSLIITVISIALVAALAVASVYYGGPALSKGTSRAAAATVVSQGQQIAGAVVMQGADLGAVVDDLTSTSNLISNDYLTSIPSLPASINSVSAPVWALSGDSKLAWSHSSNADVCLEIEKNRDSNVTAVPVTTNDGQFGCYGRSGTPINGLEVTPVVGATGEDYIVYYAM